MTVERKQYYLNLLDARAKRLNELLDIAAPENLICNEVMLLVQAAVPLSPDTFKKHLNGYSDKSYPRIAIG